MERKYPNKKYEIDEAYRAFVLDTRSRAALLKEIPPKYHEIVAHHITHAMGKGVLPSHPRSIDVIGHVDDGAGVQAAIVRVDGNSTRPDGKPYHITISIDRRSGRKPAHSNEVIQDTPHANIVSPLKLMATSMLVEGSGVRGSPKELSTEPLAVSITRDYVSPRENKLSAERDELLKLALFNAKSRLKRK